MRDDSDSDYVSESELDDIPLSFPVGGRYGSQPMSDAASSFGGLHIRGEGGAVGNGGFERVVGVRNPVAPFPPMNMDRVPVNAGDEPLPSSRGTYQGGPPAGFKLSLGSRPRQEPETSASNTHQSDTNSVPSPAPGGGKQNHEEPPCTSRGVKPPRLILSNPAAATPIGSPLTSGKKNQPGGPTIVSLLSKAFVHDTQASQLGCVRAALASRVSQSLGVGVEEMSFFEVNPVAEGAEISGTHVAVMVKDSGFNLSALEDILETNQQLQMMQQTNATTISLLVIDHKEATSAALKQTIKSTELEKDMQQLKQKYDQMEQENLALRDQLRQCDVQRQQMFNTISTLRKEFERFRSASSAHVPPQPANLTDTPHP